MITENSDIIALTAQADISRLYAKVIQPALVEFALEGLNVVEEGKNMEEFLESAQIHTHNSLCHELRRTFALVIGALFERQLRFWLSEKLPTKKKDVEKAKWPELIKLVKCVDSSITTNALMKDLENLWLIANAVRHGSGPSTESLLKKKPTLWRQTGTRPHAKRDLVDNMCIDDAQIEDYTKAVMKFWHLAGASGVP